MDYILFRPWNVLRCTKQVEHQQTKWTRCPDLMFEADVISEVHDVPVKVLHQLLTFECLCALSLPQKCTWVLFLFIHLFNFHPPVIHHSVTCLLGVCARNSFMYQSDTNLVLTLVCFTSNVAIGKILLNVAAGLAVIHYKERWSGVNYNFLNDF